MTDPSPIPPEIFDHNSAILGRVGSGKSFAARGIVEGWLAAGRRVCIVDPTDVWWGLRANAAGDGPGFPVVVFGGEHADVAIGERSGARLAEIIAERNLPAVVATADMSAGERHRFMSDFLGTLYRKNRLPLHLVLDEADDVAPQNPLPENRRMLGDVERIVRRGRVRGFRVMMITQRSAVLNKNILSQASVLVVLRLPAKQDRDAVEGWVKGQADDAAAAEVLGSLSRLQRGEGWIWAPEEDMLVRRTFPPITTYDSMRTPDHGQAQGLPTGRARPTLSSGELGDLRALIEFASTSDEAAKNSPVAVRAELEAAEQRGYERGAHETRAQLLAPLRDIIDDGLRTFRSLADARDALAHAPHDHSDSLPPQVPSLKEQLSPPIDGGASERTGSVAPAGTAANGALPSSATKMLAALASGMRLTWAQTATVAGLKARGGHFNTGRKALRDGGYIEEQGTSITATDKGIEAAGGRRPIPANRAELLGWWRSALPQTAGRMLHQLYRQNGKWIRKERLAEFLGLAPRGGHWNGAISLLWQNSLIEVKDDQLRLAAELRPREG